MSGCGWISPHLTIDQIGAIPAGSQSPFYCNVMQSWWDVPSGCWGAQLAFPIVAPAVVQCRPIPPQNQIWNQSLYGPCTGSGTRFSHLGWMLPPPGPGLSWYQKSTLTSRHPNFHNRLPGMGLKTTQKLQPVRNVVPGECWGLAV